MKIYGRVQGVAFRYYAREKALSLGIRGFVKNMPDGSVYIEASGDTDSMDRFIDWCRHGPTPARVSNIEIAEIPDVEEKSFAIR